MATAERLRSADQRIVMHGVSWRTYELLLADLADHRTPRIAFDQGRLELVSPSDEHEECRRLIGRMIDIWTLEKRIPIRGLGSTTFKRETSQRGVEADECYYIANEPLVRGRRGIDLETDPPPDLAIEVDVSGSSLGKLELYAALRVPEVWRFSRQTLRVYRLSEDGEYQLAGESRNLPGFPTKRVADWVARAQELDETTWATSFQDWLRSEQSSTES